MTTASSGEVVPWGAADPGLYSNTSGLTLIALVAGIPALMFLRYWRLTRRRRLWWQFSAAALASVWAIYWVVIALSFLAPSDTPISQLSELVWWTILDTIPRTPDIGGRSAP